MYSWVTQEQWLILSVVGLLVILKIFNYNESIFSEYNKLLTLFTPVFVLMFLGSLMELIGINRKYISLHSDICSTYLLIVLIYTVYWEYKEKRNLSVVTKICLVLASICIMIFVLLEYFF